MNKNWLLLPLILLFPAIPSAQEEMLSISKAEFEASYQLYTMRAAEVIVLKERLDMCTRMHKAQFPTF